QGIRAVLEYSRDLFDHSTIARLARHFRRLLEEVAAAPGRRLSELPLLDEGERAQVEREWNDTGAARPPAALLHRLIEAQVRRTPDAVALSAEAGALTYAGLDARANRLARHLRRLGVGPEAPVGIYLERSLDLVV